MTSPSRASRREARTPLVLLLAVLVAALVLVDPGVPARAAPAAGPRAAPAAGGADVVGDDEHDLFSGSGGVLFARSDWKSGESSRQQAAGCPDCRWKVTPLCNKATFASGRCIHILDKCPDGQQPVRVWLSHGDGVWHVVGTACHGDSRPPSVTDVTRQVRDDAVVRLPVLHAAAQPATAALIGTPVVFRTGQPAEGITDADLSVAGLDVRLDATVRWHWRFGDGVDVWTSRPGGRYPDLSVSHSYRATGSLTASVEAVWRGQFTVMDLGPFPVEGGPLTQRASVPVVVRSATAVLLR